MHALDPGRTPTDRIRNFSIIAHIDHGKSTLADRLLEISGTIKKEDMQAQVLDTMDIERERGITIKLNSARMQVTEDDTGEEYVLNLIDTPGHVDFTYEVSRSLAACEGALLVVDATQGVEAQTVSNVTLALENDLEIIPVLNKIDLPTADPDAVMEEIEEVLGIDCTDALTCSAKTGMGVAEIIQEVIKRIPPPKKTNEKPLRCLIYDSVYDVYRGVIVMFRVVDGTVRKGDQINFMAVGKEFQVDEVGVMVGGTRIKVDSLSAGEVGYMCAVVREATDATVGDTICRAGEEKLVEPLPGYTKAVPMVFCGLFPNGQQFEALKTAFERLEKSDSSLMYEIENSQVLGMGYRCGFLGVLHMEVIKERLEREYDLDLVMTAPSVEYRVNMKTGEQMTIQFANQLPEVVKIKSIEEPYVIVEIIVPEEHIGACMELAQERRSIYRSTQFLSRSRVLLEYEIPMAEMVRDFFSELKGRSRGYASMDYRPLDFRENDLVKLEFDINKTTAHPLSQIVHRSRALALGRKIALVLKEEIPRQQIKVFIQAKIGNNVIAAENIKAIRKDVLAKCYGGDITRKMKLLKKQAEGKKRMQAIGKVNVPSQAMLTVIQKT